MDRELRVLPIGRGELLRDGPDLAIIAIGSTVHSSLEAADLLEGQGIRCTVVDARFLKPLDEDLILAAVRRCGRALTVEENVAAGGFGSAVLELLASHGLAHIPVELLAVPDEFVEHGTPSILRSKYGLDPEGIARRALQRFGVRAHAARIGA